MNGRRKKKQLDKIVLPVSMRTAPADRRMMPTREMTLLKRTSNC